MSEKGKKYIANFSQDVESAVYSINDYIIKEGQRCDKLIHYLPNNSEHLIFVELKGRDIHHAIEQVEATLSNLVFKNHQANAQARIISNRIPRNSSNSELTKARNRIKKNSNCDLRALNPNTAETIKI